MRPTQRLKKLSPVNARRSDTFRFWSVIILLLRANFSNARKLLWSCEG